MTLINWQKISNLKNNILVYGAGRIAIRHIQAIINENTVGRIYVYDRKQSALNKMKTFFNQDKNSSKFIYSNNQKIIKKKKFFLAFLCTYAFNRILLIKKIKKLSNIKYFIVEKILESNIANFRKIEFVTKNIFVNMPLRNMGPFRFIKSNLNSKKINAKLVATNWNMICNSLHYINYITHITNSSVVNISIKKLKDRYKLVRENFIDFYGKIIITYANGSKLQIISKKNTSKHYFNLKQEKKIFNYNFKNEKLQIKKKNFTYKMEYVSELSNKFYKSLVKYGKVQLPTFDQALKENFLFLQEFLKKIKNKSDIFKIT
jgi:hypothetical protein